MSPPLHARRCLHHPLREAVARCPECGQSFCRECVAEHDARLLCAACLRRLGTAAPVRRGAWRRGLLPWPAAAAGLAGAGLFFYLLGRTALRLPDDFHEGAVWRRTLWEAPDQEARP